MVLPKGCFFFVVYLELAIALHLGFFYHRKGEKKERFWACVVKSLQKKKEDWLSCIRSCNTPVRSWKTILIITGKFPQWIDWLHWWQPWCRYFKISLFQKKKVLYQFFLSTLAASSVESKIMSCLQTKKCNHRIHFRRSWRKCYLLWKQNHPLLIIYIGFLVTSLDLFILQQSCWWLCGFFQDMIPAQSSIVYIRRKERFRPTFHQSKKPGTLVYWWFLA